MPSIKALAQNAVITTPDQVQCILTKHHRTMPKRPCSVIISPDKDILSADKFGDVYSLSLIQSPDWKPSQTSSAAASTANPQPPPAEASPAAAASPSPSAPSPADHHYKPQATELTVHTKRNRQALIDQQISAANPRAQRGTPRRAEVEPFERYLLLGHVSLLTAVAMGFDEQKRPYILTADRDEHIRVSRGTKEQAHVIEQFCLGHGDFVNRLCIPSGGPRMRGDLLVSAGGDPQVFVWKWKEGLLLGKAPLLDAVRSVVPEATKVAVTSLLEWSSADEEGTRIVVICERYVFVGFCSSLFQHSPTLFPFLWDDANSHNVQRPRTLHLSSPTFRCLGISKSHCTWRPFYGRGCHQQQGTSCGDRSGP